MCTVDHQPLRLPQAVTDRSLRSGDLLVLLLLLLFPSYVCSQIEGELHEESLLMGTDREEQPEKIMVIYR
jgi:hypothetical protein